MKNYVAAVALTTLLGCTPETKKETIENKVDEPAVKEIVRAGEEYNFQGPLTLPIIKYISGNVILPPWHTSIEEKPPCYSFWLQTEEKIVGVDVLYSKPEEKKRLEIILKQGNFVEIKTGDTSKYAEVYIISAADIRKIFVEETK